ncbi:putative family 20 transposase [Pseudolycoriella hygida]|uniref:Family 20 transposase n=1 Tax=Pseudolycoriella hygida TaxID=35572 RepID=A0A9Q0N7A0_9DIPT|nr:putative family 20 transposase [Pseudolycoriella hygida]
MEVTTIGIDIAKRIFQIHGVDSNGKIVLKKKLMRDQVLSFMANTSKCLIGMEACGGANHWARELIKLGYEVRLMAPQFVKPYVKTNKNDQADAEAICEAVARPNMRFVPIKSVEQQDILSIHRAVLQYGCVTSVNKIIVTLTEILDAEKLSLLSYQTFYQLKEEFLENDKKIKELEKRLKTIVMNSVQCQQLMVILGIGLITATALVASIGNAANFANGRQLSSWLGLAPKQHSSGGKEKLLAISKRGNIYLRTLLIQGGRAILNAKIRFTSEEQKSKKDYI